MPALLVRKQSSMLKRGLANPRFAVEFCEVRETRSPALRGGKK